MRRRKDLNLNLEDYLLLCDYPDRRDLLLKNQLLDVIFMHGFSRMPQLKKLEVEQDVAAVELMQTARSTINEIVTPSGRCSAEEIKRDLDHIGWQECPVTSVKKLGLQNAADDSIPIACSATTAGSSDSAITTACPVKKSRKRKKRKQAHEKENKAIVLSELVE